MTDELFDFVFTVPIGPVFDPRVENALKSLQAQSVSIAVAICDSSDTDAAKNLKAKYPDIVKYARHGDDRGQSAAINEGWRSLNGQFYGWLNVDDYLVPGALPQVLEVFEKEAATDVVYGHSLMSRGNRITGFHHEVGPPSAYLSRSNIISQPSCFVRGPALSAVGMTNEKLHYTMDWDLWIRLMKSGHRFHFLDRVLSVVCLGESTKTSSFGVQRLRELNRILRQNISRTKRMKTLLAMWHQNAVEYGGNFHLAKALNFVFDKNQTLAASFKEMKTENQSLTEFPMLHYLGAPVTTVQLKFLTPVSRRICVDNIEFYQGSDETVILPLYLSAGDIKYLSIRSENGAAVNLFELEMRQ